jgi:signal transduction histidine kinase
VFYHFTKENYQILVDLSPMDDDVKVQLYHELNKILMYLGGCSFFFLIITSLLGIVLSHRTAGPMYRFKLVFHQIQEGDISARIRLRPKDDLRDVADECNKAIDFLVNRVNPP